VQSSQQPLPAALLLLQRQLRNEPELLRDVAAGCDLTRGGKFSVMCILRLRQSAGRAWFEELHRCSCH
jgi:hypothetical protein